MAFFIANTGGPDVIGGFFPGSYKAKCVNRSGSAIAKGDVVMLDMAASADEITTNDSNSYLPGAGDSQGDSVWNTVINVTTNAVRNGGSFIGVCLDTSVADNSVGEFQFYGVIKEAFVQRTGASQSTVGGAPLTVSEGSTNGNFDAVVDTNQPIVASYLDSQDTSLTTRELKRVFLHNGFLGGGAGTAVT
jgi:hypothetical protein